MEKLIEDWVSGCQHIEGCYVEPDCQYCTPLTENSHSPSSFPLVGQMGFNTLVRQTAAYFLQLGRKQGWNAAHMGEMTADNNWLPCYEKEDFGRIDWDEVAQ